MGNEDWRQRRSYHKVSQGEPAKPPHRRTAFLIIPLILAVFFLNTLPALRGEVASLPPSPPRSIGDNELHAEVGQVIDNCASGSWGQETMDMAELLASEVEAAQGKDDSCAMATVTYLRLLVSRDGAATATDTLLTEVALFLADTSQDGVPQDVLDRYRLALDNTKAT